MSNPTNNIFTSIVKRLGDIKYADKLELEEYNEKHDTNRPTKNGSNWDEIINLSILDKLLLKNMKKRQRNGEGWCTLTRHDELMEISMYNKDQVSIEVYLPIITGRTQEIRDKRAELEKEKDIMSLFRHEKRVSNYSIVHDKYYISDLQIAPDTSYGDLIIPLTHLSKKCTLQKKRICRKTRTIETTNQSILVFVFTYKEYMELLKMVCDHDSSSRNWIKYGINN